ncbi:hypothetical protein GCM10009304_30460 [Pseudomonas matsuisoli]|uniref:Uncharacterized protein n=1 Tax=Pseudomonas matsuisoli TaxID=1515666 RepID=A0A917PZ68_9PSED|nr:hypothetical protein GCM10009304_30460 [Pseudomonas matsuisoli]
MVGEGIGVLWVYSWRLRIYVLRRTRLLNRICKEDSEYSCSVIGALRMHLYLLDEVETVSLNRIVR